MINFIKRKWYLVLVTVCVVGFAAGYFLKLQPLNEVKAANDYNETEVSNEDYADIQRYTDVFSEGQYSCSYANGIVVVSLENSTSRSMGAVYTTNDILQLNEEIMNTEEPMIVTDTDDCSVTYEEYKNGYPTGALASYVFDENGNIIEAYFREGEIYSYPDSVISCEEAYNMAIAAIMICHLKLTTFPKTLTILNMKFFTVPQQNSCAMKLKK